MERVKERTYPLNTIYFYLTEGCNLRCRHCWIAPRYQTRGRSYPSLPFNLFKSIVDQAKPLGLSGVKLTGGEPLLHPQIKRVLEFIRSEDLNLSVETNGVLCTAELSREIASCKNPFVAVSLDGANAEIHEWVRGVSGCFGAALEGIRNLIHAGLKPQVIMSLVRRNKNQMEAVVRLAETFGAGSVKFNIVQPTSRGEKMHRAGETLTVEELINLGWWVENTLSASTSLQIHFHHPPAFRPLGRMFSENGDGCSCCGITGILGVLADGSYALCGIGETVPELVFGHSNITSLKDVWNKNTILIEIRNGVPHRLEGVCRDCLMKNICHGSCIAQNYYLNKNLWASYWFCEEANTRGLFPGSRMVPKA